MTHSGQDGKEDKGPGNYCILDSMMDPVFREYAYLSRTMVYFWISYCIVLMYKHFTFLDNASFHSPKIYIKYDI